MTTYHVTLYTLVSNNYIILAESAAGALKQAREKHIDVSLNESDYENEHGYCVSSPETDEYHAEDENPLDEEDER